MTDKKGKQPPAFPKELLNRPRPRGILNAEQHVAKVADKFREEIAKEKRARLDAERALIAADESSMGYLELLQGLQLHIAEAIGLMDAGKQKEARQSLDRAVVMLDSRVDFSRLAEPDHATTPNERPPRQLTKKESDGLADFLISHSGTIAGAKAVLLKDGPDDARSKLTDAVHALERHLATIRVTKHGE
jgi:hypothetical protein